MPTANRVRRRRNSGSSDEPAPANLNVPRPDPSLMTRSSSTSRLIGLLSTSPNDVTNLPQLTSMSPPLIHSSAPFAMPILQPVSTFDLRPALPSTSQNQNLSLVPQRSSVNPSIVQLENKGDIAKLISRSKPMLLIESLILLICQQREPDPSRQISLFNSVCSELESSGFLGSSYKIDVLYQMRRIFGSHMHQLINQKLSQVGKTTNIMGDRQITSPIAPLIDGMYGVELHENNRYRKYFIQKSLMSQGGFGKVYQATYTFDMVDYAVKVISFTVTNCTDTSKVLKEVQVYANLPSHPNVVGYKTAWLEMEMFSSTDSLNHGRGGSMKKVSSIAPSPASDAPSVDQETNDDRSSESTSTRSNSHSLTSFTSTGESSLPSKRGMMDRSSSQSDDVIFLKSDSSCLTDNFPLDNLHPACRRSDGVQITELPDSPVTNDSLCTVFRHRTESTTLDTTMTRGASKKLGERSDRLVTDLKDTCGGFNEATLATGIASNHSKVNSQGPIIKLYIQMELCRNENLKKWIKKRNKRLLSSSKLAGGAALPYDEYVTAIEMYKQIVTGVEFLHRNNLIHRDLKPQNILFDLASGSVLKIGDFGLATLNEKSVHVCDLAHNEDGACDHGCLKNSLPTCESPASCSGRGTAVDKHTAGLGTAIYVAPEQKNTNNYNSKADMYSLGIILLELICPFYTDSEKAKVIDSLKNGRTVPSSLSTAYPCASQLILSLTSAKPSERPSAGELLRSHDIFPSSEQQILHLKDELSNVKMENSSLIAENENLKAIISELNRKLNDSNP